MSEEEIRRGRETAAPGEDTMEQVYAFPLQYKTNYVQTTNLDSGYQLVKILAERKQNAYPDAEESLA